MDALPPFRRGDHGESIKELQRVLTARGFDAGVADGIFGARTEAAVRAFQATFVTGIADERTLAALARPPQPVPIAARVTADIVARMFHPLTPRQNIERYLPLVLDALVAEGLGDKDRKSVV